MSPMRAERGLALVLLAGCAGDEAQAPPDPAMVNALVEVQLAEARAGAAHGDVDSARASALSVHASDAGDLARWLDNAAADPASAELLWDAVADQIDAERLSGHP